MRGFGDIIKGPNGNCSSETIQHHWRDLKGWTQIKRSMNLQTLQKKLTKEKFKAATPFCVLNNIAPACQRLHQHLLFDFWILAVLVVCDVVFHGGFI